MTQVDELRESASVTWKIHFRGITHPHSPSGITVCEQTARVTNSQVSNCHLNVSTERRQGRIFFIFFPNIWPSQLCHWKESPLGKAFEWISVASWGGETTFLRIQQPLPSSLPPPSLPLHIILVLYSWVFHRMLAQCSFFCPSAREKHILRIPPFHDCIPNTMAPQQSILPACWDLLTLFIGTCPWQWPVMPSLSCFLNCNHSVQTSRWEGWHKVPYFLANPYTWMCFL